MAQIESTIIDGNRVQIGSRSHARLTGAESYSDREGHLRNPTTNERIDRPIYSSSRSTSSNNDSSNSSLSSDYETVYEEIMKGAQGQINALRDYENTLLKEQAVINEKNDRSTSSISTLTGLGGSSEANVAQQETTAKGQQANKLISNEIQTRIQEVLGNVRQSAVEEARSRREEARMNEAQRLETRAAQQEQAVFQLQNLAAGGVTFDGLKSGDPESFAYLANQFGGEQALRGAFVLNTPQDQILDKRMEGGNYIIAKQNPVTGKISVETVDLGLPPQFTKTVDAGNRIIAIPDNWSGDPSELVTLAKGLTPGQSASLGGGGGRLSGLAQGVLNGDVDISKLTPTQYGQVMNEIAASGHRLPADDSLLEYETSRATRVLSVVDKAISQVGSFSAGAGSLLSGIPGSAAKDLQSTLTTIKANIGFQELQAMRAASPTGGALGQVAVQELNALQAVLGNLDTSQSPRQLKENLEAVKTHYNNWLSTVKQANEQTESAVSNDYESYLKTINL